MKLTDEQIERAKTVNLPQFLLANGFDLKKSGREYVWKEHDSLHIRDNAPGERGRWYRFSESKGGDNIGFLREYMGMSFVEAVEALNGEHYERTYTSSRTYEPKPIQKTASELSLVEADNAKRVFAYLCKTRGLDYDMVSALVRGGSISQEEKTGNVLFKYFDENGKVIGAEKVGTSTEHKFKGIATGSAGGHGFEVCRGDGSNLLFFESSIDMLSYLQMFSPDNCRLVSMMGVKPNIVLDTMVRYGIAPQNVYLCSDNDTAGNDFADRLREQYPEMKRIVTPDTYKDWNDMLRGIPKVAEQEKDKKEADRKNMQYYGNEMWNKATDNRDKSLVTMRLSDFQRVRETLEKSGINYYAYEMNGAVRMAVNDKDIDWLRNILGNVNITKSNKPYSPPEKNIFGTAEYRYIPQKEYLTADRDLVLKTAEIMARRGIQFSGRVYPSGKGTLTVSHADLYAVRSIRDEMINMRKQFASSEKGEPVGNRDYRANRDTHYYMSKLTPEQFKEVKPFLETSVGYHAVSRDGKVAFAVDKENAPAFHRAFENAVREVGMLRNMSDLGLPMEQMIALSPVIHRLAVEDMKLDLADFFDKRYDEAQFGEMLSLVNAYLSQAPAERYGENSKLNDMLEAKSSFDRAIELSDFFSQHDFSDEQRAAVTAMFVGDVTRGQIESIDETFTAEDIQAYDEILHNALQESDVADFLTAHKQTVIDRENAARVPTEEEALFPKANLAKFLAERSLSSDEWEDMAYPLFENGHLDKFKPNDKSILGYHLSEPALYDLARRYHDGEDICKELALGLLEGSTTADIEFVFEQGEISDRTFYYAENLRHSLHLEKTDDGYNCTFGGMERFVSFEEIGQAFIDRTHEEFEDLMYWRVLDYIKDDIPDITDETVQQLITAFDDAALHGWDKGDNQAKLNRIKKALLDILGNEEQTENAFACIAKQKYNVTFEAESSIYFGLLGNGITAYDVSRTDKETNDYPTVAHISPEGVVRIYDSSISAKDMERINEQARLAREKFMTDWNMLSPEQQFQRLYDRSDISTTVNINREKLTLEQTVEKYMPFVFFGEGERPEPEAEKHIKSAVESIEFIGDRNSFETVKKAAQSQSFGTTVADGDTLTVVINDNADVKDVRRLVETAQDNGIYLNVPSAKMLESRFGADFMQESHKPVVEAPEVKKVHQVITNAGFDGGIDDKMEYETVDEAVKAGRDYIADGYLGFSVYNQETKKIEHIEGDFPLDEAFNPNILRINGMHEMANEVQARMDEIEKNVPEPDTKDLGAVVMRKVGDFYEMYGTNAEIGEEVLGLRMLSKNGQPMVGFPDHVKDEYSAKLKEAGYSVLMQSSSQLYGIEIDSLSGRIAQALYPNADIAIQGFEKNSFQNGCFDVAVGNVPFGDLGFKDEKHGTSKLHDFFFSEGMDKLKNGGIMAFVTSAGTLDKRDETTRQMLADKADFIGAIRLPGGKNGAFKDNAGTEVTTDIIFLKKHEGKSVAELSDIPDWVHIGETADGLPINKYFEQHPDMVLGTVVEGNKLYGSGTMVIAEDSFDLRSALHEAVSKLSAEISHEHGRDVYAKTADGVQVQIPSNLRNYSFFLSDDQVYFKKNNAACEFRFDKGTAQHKRFKAFIEMRDLTRELLEAQELDKPDSVIKDLQARLNTAYDDFYAKYGLIHSQTNKRYFSEDVSYNLVAGLEKSYDKNVLKEKSDIFFKRTIVPPKAIDHVETALEALTLSVAEKARVDFEYMGKLTGMTEDELKHDLMGEIFKVPHTENGYQTASEYLSGDIRAKLREAEEIAEYDADFNINVSALKAAMPEPLKAGDIDVKIGATWLDPKYYEQFIYELLQTPKYQRSDSPAAKWNKSAVIGVEYSEHTNSFHVSNKSSDKSVLATQKFGSHNMNAYDIFEHILNLQDPKIYKIIEVPDPEHWGETKEKRVVDIDSTRVVQRKADNIRKAFKNWIFKDPVRREAIVQRYNELFNSIRPREYDGSALSFPMMTSDIQLHNHQKNAIAHAMFGGNTLFAHSVGAGKTFEMIATAMESKRLGLCTKSLFAVPNHLTEQIGDDFQKLYPSANILVATKKDFKRENRQQLFAKIATGNYDAVIIGHSQLGMIPVSKERQVMTIQSQIDDILQGIEELKRSEGSKFQIKAMERTRKSLQKQLDKLEKSNQDDTITFEQLGVDKIFLDEAHEFKNLFTPTKLTNIAGISNSASQKALDLFLKCQYLDEKTGGKGVVFATGTPLSNSITELHTMMRYLEYDFLRDHGLQHFDNWVSVFGEQKTDWELAPAGNKFKERTRIANYTGLPELMSMFKQVADIRTADTLNLDVPECEYKVVQVEATPFQQELVQELADRADAINAGNVEPPIDNMLKITSDGRKLGLDPRLIDPSFEDNPQTKLNQCVENVARIHSETAEDKLRQHRTKIVVQMRRDNFRQIA